MFRSAPGRLRRVVTLALPVTLAVALAPQLPAWAAPRKKLGTPAAVKSVPGAYVKPDAPSRDATADRNMHTTPAVSWPAAAQADINLAAGAASAAAQVDVGAMTAVPGMPIRVAPVLPNRRAVDADGAAAERGPTSVRVQVLDHEAGGPARPVVTRLTRTDSRAAAPGSVRVALDYRGFRNAYGGDWSNRLRLVLLPECALRTPDAPECRSTEVGSVNDPTTGLIGATVPLTSASSAAAASTLVALVSSPQSTGGGGDFGATPLAATSSWSAGGQAGDFSWSYPIRTPEAFGGPSPGVGLSYSSQSLDGRTAATNSQPSWIGDGFDYAAGAISRSYAACVDDGKTGVGDLCWTTDNATMSLPGHAGELIQVSTSPDVWKLKKDDGTKIERLTGATNGARNGEYWRVSTTDGWVYSFGLNRLPGWTSGKGTTQSVFTVPVFGNNAGEPCYNATFANAWCDQAYTWNLDYVVDPHGNSMSLWYSQQLNHYGRNATGSAVSTYVRAGHLDHIDYGTRQDGGVDSVLNAAAPARVVFGLQDRCITQGSTCTQSTKSNWPDVPWDQQCDSTSSCTDVLTPAFFSQKKLSTITTQIWTGTGNDYRDVERWTLNQVFKDPGDGHAKTLWLNSISHAGLDGMTTTMPDITFQGVQLNNRVDTSSTKDPIIRFRISSVVNETGGKVSVNYSAPECVTGSNMPASADTNTLRCYPVWWTPYGQTAATFDWFHKYVVTSVNVADPTGHAPLEATTYTYQGAPAWHYDDNEVVPANHKSWGQWRGYGKVRVVHGAADSAQEQVDTVFFRGMHGDKTSSGTRTVTIPADPDFGGAAINDEDWRNGQTREVIKYNGVGDAAPVLSKTLTEPWEYGPTASRTRNGVTAKAYVASTRSSTTKLALDGGRGWLTSKTTNTFDADTGLPDPFGRIVKVDDANDLSRTDDDRCTTTTYATDPNGRIRSAVAREQKVAVACGATPDLGSDTISDMRTWYDGATSFDGVVSKGDVTRAEQVSNVVNGQPVYLTKNESTYDTYGRVLTSKDTLGHTTTTAYVPASGALTTSMTVTNPKGWTTTTTINPAYGASTSIVDPNGVRTDANYDGLGRTTEVWLPGRNKSTQTPSKKYAYAVNGGAEITSIATSVLNTDGSGYLTTYELFDGQMRPRQTQKPAVGGGVLVTDALYDSRGLQIQANHTYFQATVGWGTLFTPSGPVPGRTLTTYDNAGRANAQIFQVLGVERWRTTTAFGGDRTDTTPPAGATATSVYMNALGQTTQVRQYHGNTPTGVYDSTIYTFDKRGNPKTIVGPDGSVWSFDYDLRGRNIHTVDPDRGETTYTYNDANQQLTSTDARNSTITSVYDELGRVTARYSGTVATGTKLVDTVYDTLMKGQATKTTRYVNGNAYEFATLEYDSAYRAIRSSVTIPSSEGALAGTYQASSTYNANGSVHTSTLPAVGGVNGGSLPQETLTYGYNDLGLSTTLGGSTPYVSNTFYDSFGRVATLEYNDGGAKTLRQVWAFEEGTERLLEHGAYDPGTDTVFQDVYYNYDNAGNVLSIKDQTNQYGAGPDDNQCFRYDYFGRLTNAWTPTDGNCAADPATVAFSALGGPAPYWQSWTYDTAGDRKTQTDKTASSTTTATSAYPATSAARPHAVTKVDAVTGSTTATSTFQYDAAGNLTTRAIAGKPSQTLTWDAEGHLASVTDNNSSATYVYDPAGSRLITHDSTGATLYLGAQQVHISTNNQITSTRFYGSGAVRTSSNGLCWTLADNNGTNNLVLKASDLSKTQRRSTPFGGARGTNTAWPTDRGFVGGLNEPTGLVQLGARPYDPGLGRFVAVDPVFDSGDPQSFNGYSYAHNSPVTRSDPSGLSDVVLRAAGSPFITQYTRGGYRYTDVGMYVYVCRSDGMCLTWGGGLMPWGVAAPGTLAVAYLLILRFVVKLAPPAPGTQTYGPYVPKKIHPVQPLAACPTPPPPPPPPPSCGFFDVGCLWDHPGRWWGSNKAWVQGAVAVAGIVTCGITVGAGCAIAGAVGAGISIADRTYSFVQNKEYNDGAMAWGMLGLGLVIDATGAIPGGRGAALAAEEIERGGLATMHYYPGVGRSGHFSIEVTNGTELEHMQLMPYNGTAWVGRVKDGSLPAPSMSHTFDVPDADAALDYMRGQVGNQGPYHPLSNSCLTFCTRSLAAGGVNAPTDKAAIPWIKNIFAGG